MMIPNRSNQHLLSCLGAIGLGVVLPCFLPAGLVAGSAVAIGATIAGGSAAAAGGLGGNLLANWLQKKFEKRENDPSLPDRNHDLLRVTANAVAHEIGEYGRCHSSSHTADQVRSIQWLSSKAPKVFLDLFEQEELEDIPHPDPKTLLTVAARDKVIPPTGNLEDWETVVNRLAGHASVSLPVSIEKEIAERLHRHLWEAIRKALKKDFSNDGKGYAALHLEFMGDVMSSLNELIEARNDQDESTRISQELLDELHELKIHSADPKAHRISEKAPPGLQAKVHTLLQRYEQVSVRVDKGFRQLQNEVRVTERNSRSRDLTTHRHLYWLLGGIAAILTLGLVAFLALRQEQQKQGADTEKIVEKVEQIDVSLDAYIIEATAIVNRYLDANEELRETIGDREAEIGRVAFALREAQSAADNGDALAEEVLAEVRKTGDIQLLHDTMVRLAAEQYAKAQATFEQRQRKYIEDCRSIASLAYITGNIESAEYHLNEILDVYPGDIDATNRLGWVYELRGELDSAEEQYSRLLDLSPANNAVRAAAYNNLGQIAWARSDFDLALSYHLKAINIFTQIGDGRGRAGALGNIGLIYYEREEFDTAGTYFSDSLAIFQEIDDPTGRAGQLGNLGGIAMSREQFDTAESLFQESLEIFKSLGILYGQASSLGNLGVIARKTNDLEGAEKLHLEALKIDTSLGRIAGQASHLSHLGFVSSARKRYEEAESYHRRALDIERELGRRVGEVHELSNLGEIAVQQNDYVAAHSYYHEALIVAREANLLLDQALVLAHLGWIALDQERYVDAERFFTEALSFERQLDRPEDKAVCLNNLGGLALYRQDLRQAETYYSEAIELYRVLEDNKTLADLLVNLGVVMAQSGRYNNARQLWQEGQELYSGLGIQSKVDQMTELLRSLP